MGEAHALIGNEEGRHLPSEDVEGRTSWSQTATKHRHQKYFHGKPGTAQREGSVRQLISRVVNTIVALGRRVRVTLADMPSPGTLSAMKLTHSVGRAEGMAFKFAGVVQRGRAAEAAMLGVPSINSVQDNMESIHGVDADRGMLFKWGSGRGTNFSTLRGSKER